MPETIRILCVDDEINILNVIRRQLCDLAAEVPSVCSPEEGLRFLRQTQPVHVVVSDYRMPGTNGLEFLLSVSREWPEASRILLTGFADTAAVQDALERGTITFSLTKPWRSEELQKIITGVIVRNAAQPITEVQQS